MTRITTLTNPLLLGFEEMERLIEKITKSSNDGYPPYNIEKVITDTQVKLKITLAVAGFLEEELLVEIESNQLVIRGKQQADDGKEYLHRGIAARQFQKSFVLAEGIEVEEAELKNGLLSINLKRPEPKIASRRINITSVE